MSSAMFGDIRKTLYDTVSEISLGTLALIYATDKLQHPS